MVGPLARRPPPLPGSWRLGWASGSRRHGDLLIGGYPTRIVRLDSAAAKVVDLLRAGATIADAQEASGVEAGLLARRLVAEGFAWADPARAGCDAVEPQRFEQVTIVVPALNAAHDLSQLLGGASAGLAERWIVVDDGSSDATAEAAAELGAEVARHAATRGPAAARNTGWRLASTPIVLFADADAELPADWSHALAHFADPLVAAVVPRVAPTGRQPSAVSTAEAYEAARFVYDLGEDAGDVGPSRRLLYATSVLIFVRTDALIDIGGFADDLRYGEDLDLVRRLAGAGWTIRYEPRCVGSHRARTQLGPLLRLHHHYATPLAELSRRGGRGAGIGSTTSAAVAGAALVVAGLPIPAIAVMAAGTMARAASMTLLSASAEEGSGPPATPTLRGRAGVSSARLLPLSVAASLAARTELRALRTMAAAATGPWLPVAALVARRSRAGTAALVAAAVGRHLADWRRIRPDVDPVTWVVLRAADEMATASGLWRGCLRTRTLAPLLPRLVRLRGRKRRRRSDAAATEVLAGWEDLSVLGWAGR